VVPCWNNFLRRSTDGGGSGLKFFKIIILTWNHALAAAVVVLIVVKGKCNDFTYSIPSVGLGADPGIQAVSLQVTVSHPPGSRLPLLSARPAVTSPAAEHHALWPVPSYTACWQRHIGVNNLPKVAAQRYPEQDLNPRPIDRKSKAVVPCQNKIILKNFSVLL